MLTSILIVAMTRETDPWIARQKLTHPVDMTYQINSIINHHLNSCASHSNINTVHQKCLNELKQVESEVDSLSPTTSVKFGDSVYRYSKGNAIVDWLGQFFAMMRLAPSITLIRDVPIVIGTDKLAHFFETGYEYYVRGETLGVEYGIKTEQTYFGLGISGVYSHADLYANLKGFDFWTQLVPYHLDCNLIKCSIANPFELDEYFDLNFDESINLSHFTRTFVNPSQITPCTHIPYNGSSRFHHAIHPSRL